MPNRDDRTTLARDLGATPQGMTAKAAARSIADLIARDGNTDRAIKAIAKATGLTEGQAEAAWMKEEGFYE